MNRFCRIVLIASSLIAAAGCSRNRQEAVIKANEADKEVTLNPEGAISKYEESTALDKCRKAGENDPNQIRYYATLADLYIRLGLLSQAEAVLKEAKSFAKPGDKSLFGVHVLLSQVYQDKGSDAEMVTELEAAKAV